MNSRIQEKYKGGNDISFVDISNSIDISFVLVIPDISTLTNCHRSIIIYTTNLAPTDLVVCIFLWEKENSFSLAHTGIPFHYTQFID